MRSSVSASGELLIRHTMILQFFLTTRLIAHGEVVEDLILLKVPFAMFQLNTYMQNSPSISLVSGLIRSSFLLSPHHIYFLSDFQPLQSHSYNPVGGD